MWTCELTGERVWDAVVTPSGHICSRRVLMQRWGKTTTTTATSSGDDEDAGAAITGIDPFDETGARTLNLQDCIRLRGNTNNGRPPVPPRPAAATSFGGLLQHLQIEYDAVLQELIDTRTALETTRQELSLALYQNDAAVRVVARLLAERDAKRSAPAAGDEGDVVAPPNSKKARRTSSDEAAAPTASGAAAAANAEAGSIPTRIPASDAAEMMAVWESLHPTRKGRQKEAAARAPRTVQALAILSTSSSSSSAVLQGHRILTAAAWQPQKVLLHVKKNDDVQPQQQQQQHVLAYNIQEEKAERTLVVEGPDITSLDAFFLDSKSSDGPPRWIWGRADGSFQMWNHDLERIESHSSLVTNGDGNASNAVVHIQWHPDGIHAVAALAHGAVAVLRGVEVVALLPTDRPEPNNNADDDDQAMADANAAPFYTTAALHPDGLIYITGTATGLLRVWDFQRQTIASTLSTTASATAAASIQAIAISNNGYHVAAAHADHTVRIWDLRKQSLLHEKKLPGDCTSVQFDPSGKYLACACSEHMVVLTVKEWDQTITLPQAAVQVLWPDLVLTAVGPDSISLVGESKS